MGEASDSFWGLALILVFFLIISVGATAIKGATGFYDEENVTAKVLKMERIVEDDGDSYYLVYCDVEVFTIVDDWAKGRWNSSDLYRDIEIGKTYNFSVYGWRIPQWSKYRNIMSAEEMI